MNWRNKKVIKLSGFLIDNKSRELANVVNHNAEVLKEAVLKIEELSKEIDKLKGGGE